MKHNLIFTMLLALVLIKPVQAADFSSNNSAYASMGVSMMVALSPVFSTAASGNMVVESVDKTAEGVVMVLRGVGNGASAAGKFSVKVVGDVSGATSLVVGESVQVVAETVGSAIIASGKVIAYIPNEMGKSLIHHSRVDVARVN